MHPWVPVSTQILEWSAQASAGSLGHSLAQGMGHPDRRFSSFTKWDLPFTLMTFLADPRFCGTRFLQKLMAKYSLWHKLNTLKDLKITKRWQEVGWTWR